MKTKNFPARKLVRGTSLLADVYRSLGPAGLEFNPVSGAVSHALRGTDGAPVPTCAGVVYDLRRYEFLLFETQIMARLYQVFEIDPEYPRNA